MAGDYYSRISARFWIDTKGWGERNQLVALYLLTNTHSTMEGLYHLPLGYLCADLSLTAKQAAAALAFIEKAGVVSYDPDAEVVFVRKALKHGAPKTKNHITGAVNRLRSVPWSPLWDEFLVACQCHASALADAIRKERATPLASSVSSSSSNPPFNSPRGNLTAVAPVKPKGNRDREHREYRAAMDEWCSEHFPAAEPEAVGAAVSWLLPRTNRPVTAGDVWNLCESNPVWAAQLGQEAAA
jgi:hypothetical protein